MRAVLFWLQKDEGDVKNRTKIEIVLEAFLIGAMLIGVLALVSAVQKAGNGPTLPAVNGSNPKN
jgi:hypothetical protein